MSARRVRPLRLGVLAALPALAAGMLATGLTVPAWAATDGANAAPAAAAAPTTTVKNGPRSVSVSPASGTPGAASSIAVTGSGFSGQGDLWVAICLDGTGAPDKLDACLGGPIPGKNVTDEWATVTDNPDFATSGLNVVQWQGTGFNATLQLTSAADASANCVTGKCSVYVRSSENGNKQDVTVPIAFQPAAGSSSSSSATSTSSSTESSSTASSSTASSSTASSSTASSSTASSSTASSSTASSSTASFSTASFSTASSTTASSTPPVPTTVQPQSILLDKVQQGRDQVVVFDGFTPGEAVSASISGNPPVELTVPAASSSGSVRVAWKVPATFPVAGYSLRVDGAKSLRVGVASFSVVAAPVVSTVSSTVSAKSTAPSVTSSVASATAPSSTPSSTAASAASSASAPSTTASVVAPAPANTSSKTLWWLWITLAAVVLVALVVGAVALGRRHRQETEAERAAVEADLAAAAGEEAARQQQATMIANQPPRQPINPGAPGEYDEHPDRPILFSHRQAEHYSPPTDPIDGGDAPTQAIGGTPRSEAQPPPPQESTQSWRPDFSQDQSAAGQPAAGQPVPEQSAPEQSAPDQSAPDQPAPDQPSQDEPGSGTQLFDALADDDTSAAPNDNGGNDNGDNGGNGNGGDGGGRHRGDWSPPAE